MFVEQIEWARCYSKGLGWRTETKQMDPCPREASIEGGRIIIKYVC